MVKVNDRVGYVTFIDAAGTELIPPNTVPVTLSARMAYIYCQLMKVRPLDKSKQIKVTLFSRSTGIDAPAVTTTAVSSGSGMTTNAPIGSLSLHQDIQR